LEDCAETYLTEELLHDLNNFDFKVFLNSGDYLSAELPFFFEWIKE
jgi:hypothetical protein